jgi:ammonia channel protein AmtB
MKGWVWGDHGFLKRLGYVDFAGSSAVHVLGGTSAFVAAYMLKPRLRRMKTGVDGKMGPPPPPGENSNVIMGVFILWSVHDAMISYL